MKPFAFKFTGYIKPTTPPPAEKVTLLASSGATPPTFTANVTNWKPPPSTNVFMQNQQPSCLADGVCQAIEYYVWKNTGNVVRLNRRFLWALCVQEGGIPASEGTTLINALTTAEKYGVCEESLLDDDTTLPVATYADTSVLTTAMYANAEQYKIASWSLLGDLSFSGLNTAISQNDIVITAMQISDWWWTAPSGATSWAADDILPLRPIDETHPEVSGHCVVLYAYDQLQHYILNWWSDLWGYEGRGWYRIDEAPAVYEAAIITVVTPTSPAPTPTPSVSTASTPVDNPIMEVVQEIERLV